MTTELKFPEDLELEIEAINSIYCSRTLCCLDEDKCIFLLTPPELDIGLRIHFPARYPEAPPEIQGLETLASAMSRGCATEILQAARTTLEEAYEPGNVCVFNLLENLSPVLAEKNASTSASIDDSTPASTIRFGAEAGGPILIPGLDLKWTRSEVITQNKSTFIGFATRLDSSALVTRALESLLASNKKIAKATQ